MEAHKKGKQDCGTGVSPVLTTWAGYTFDTAAESLCRDEPGAIGNFIRRSLAKTNSPA